MPIREFRCQHDHVTERLLTGDADKTTRTVMCSHVKVVPGGTAMCVAPANRIDFSPTGTPQFVHGCGGFYKPSEASE